MSLSVHVIQYLTPRPLPFVLHSLNQSFLLKYLGTYSALNLSSVPVSLSHVVQMINYDVRHRQYIKFVSPYSSVSSQVVKPPRSLSHTNRCIHLSSSLVSVRLYIRPTFPFNSFSNLSLPHSIFPRVTIL